MTCARSIVCAASRRFKRVGGCPQPMCNRCRVLRCPAALLTRTRLTIHMTALRLLKVWVRVAAHFARGLRCGASVPRQDATHRATEPLLSYATPSALLPSALSPLMRCLKCLIRVPACRTMIRALLVLACAALVAAQSPAPSGGGSGSSPPAIPPNSPPGPAGALPLLRRVLPPPRPCTAPADCRACTRGPAQLASFARKLLALLPAYLAEYVTQHCRAVTERACM
jgi:hypothetical protein